MDRHMEQLLAKRRDRAIAIILSEKERSVDAHVDDVTSRRLRKVILDQVNDFYDLATDLIDSVGEGSGVVMNEAWMDRIDEIYEAVVPDGTA